ncbi:MAG TPA: alcohol dehydrogenase catalytic domain-containing protein [Bacteroidota bacterium]|nr:alcohol dehydrogenase catalytic domain-containing protein [Bacteroidota bacterium]
MKAAYLTGIGKFEISQAADPQLAASSDVLVRISAVGVCGSDIHYYTSGRIGSQVVKFPFIVGHEAAGVVERIGRSVKRVKPGQRIAIDPAVSCGQCDQCEAGREHTCRRLRFLGAPGQMDGALREFVVMDEKNCFPIDDGMTIEQGVLSEPLAIAVYSVEQSRLPRGANVAILGVGPIGMSVFHVLRTQSIGNIYITDRLEDRLSFSKQLKPTWTGNPDNTNIVKEIALREPLMVDVVYDCSGDPSAIRQGVELLKPGGRLVLVGIPEVDEISFPIHELRRREITIVNIRRQVHCTQKAIDLLARGQVAMDSTVTHRFPLEKTGEAFDLVAGHRNGVMKAVITFD